jgi:2-methylcitrate dehydratase PrpD
VDYLDRLAAFVAATRFDALPASTVAAAKLVLLDTLGAIVAGSAVPENGELARLAASRAPHGAATLLGHRRKSDAFWAALTNATAGVALEVDEGSRLGGGHPAIHVVPGALAVAEERRVDGRRLLESVVAGYEIGSRIGGATTVRPNVHSHGTWGTISTAVAVAKLGSAPAQTVRAAMNLAASMSPANTWTPALDGATIRNLYPGRSAFQGILAVELERCGFTGLGDAPSDVYGTILAERFEPELAVAGIEELARNGDGSGAYRIEQNYFKLHACCRFNHFALDAVMALRSAYRLSGNDIERVEIVTIPFAVRMGAPAPASSLAARFSIPWAVAAALVLGRTDPQAFDSQALADERIRALAQRVEIRTSSDMTPRRADAPTAHVRLVLRGGKSFERTTSVVRGDTLSPVPRDEITAKFVSLAGPVLGDASAGKIIDVVEKIDSLDDVGSLTAMLAP